MLCIVTACVLGEGGRRTSHSHCLEQHLDFCKGTVPCVP